jgi:hypothetical protein
VARSLKGHKPTIRDYIEVQMLYTLAKARNITLKAEMLMKERASGSGKFDHFKRLYNEVNKFSTIDKGKGIQASKQPPTRPDIAKPDKASGR